VSAFAGDDAEREAAAALVGECPTRLHEEDRLVLLPGVVAVRAWGLAWLVPLATLGLLASRALPPDAAAGLAGVVLTPINATGGWGIPAPAHALVGQLIVVAAALAVGLWLATWKPGGVTPRQYALAWARHAVSPGLAAWRPGGDYAPPPAAENTAGAHDRRRGSGEGEEELAWAD
jgi:hypothetical protein